MDSLLEFKADVSIRKFLYSSIILNHTEYKRYTIFPDGCDYILFSSKGYRQIFTKNKALQFFTVEDESIFILRLKPYTLKLLNQNDYLFKSQSITFASQVFRSKSILKQMDMINDIFLKHINLDEKLEQLFFIIDIIYQAKGTIEVTQLSQKLNISTRTLQRWFKEFIGLTPKEYISIIQLQHNIKKIKKIKYIKEQNTPRTYTDYSHFFKAFKQLTGMSPTSYYNSSIQHIRSIYDIY